MAIVWILLAVEYLVQIIVVFCYKLRHITNVKVLYMTHAVLLVNINNIKNPRRWFSVFSVLFLFNTSDSISFVVCFLLFPSFLFSSFCLATIFNPDRPCFRRVHTARPLWHEKPFGRSSSTAVDSLRVTTSLINKVAFTTISPVESNELPKSSLSAGVAIIYLSGLQTSGNARCQLLDFMRQRPSYKALY